MEYERYQMRENDGLQDVWYCRTACGLIGFIIFFLGAFFAFIFAGEAGDDYSLVMGLGCVSLLITFLFFCCNYKLYRTTCGLTLFVIFFLLAFFFFLIAGETNEKIYGYFIVAGAILTFCASASFCCLLNESKRLYTKIAPAQEEEPQESVSPPEQQPELQPEQQPELQPEQQPELQPEQQPELQPEQQAELQPEQQAELQPEQQAELQPEQQPELPADQQPVLPLENLPEPPQTNDSTSSGVESFEFDSPNEGSPLLASGSSKVIEPKISPLKGIFASSVSTPEKGKTAFVEKQTEDLPSLKSPSSTEFEKHPDELPCKTLEDTKGDEPSKSN